MDRRLILNNTPLAGLFAVQRRRVSDARGFLERMFCADELRDALGARRIAQINRTLTESRGTVRGMHLQLPPHAETKLVLCLRGEVFDVAIDLRAGSRTFLKWHGEVLSAQNCRGLLIPEGFAHGFQTLTSACELLYLHTHPYVATAEFAVNATDSRIAIEWPLPVGARSARDEAHPLLTANFGGVAP